jgi:fumarylacetoacetase
MSGIFNTKGLSTWVDIPENSDFSIHNIPFGVFTYFGQTHCGSRLGDFVIDLAQMGEDGWFDDLPLGNDEVFHKNTLNPFIALGKEAWTATRNRIIELFQSANNEIRDNEVLVGKYLIPISEVKMEMPVNVGDYTDFYSSIEHATNVGTMFRDPDNALFPNWRHLPVGYHGRASSIVVSGTNIHRPYGQTMPKGVDNPVFGPSRLVDFELEMAFITGNANELGDSIDVNEADKHIFGMVIFNDLSARDIQKWEYVPLGPFLAKNFGSVISPWVVTLDALEEYRVSGPQQEPEVFPYLQSSGDKNIDIKLEVALQPENSEETVVCISNYKYMYWNMNQQLAHQTINGCNVKAGDMYASGTISGPTPDSYGSMLELSWQGTKSIPMKNGSERKFINDNDTIIMRAYCEKEGRRVGFGESVCKILPAK